jgi:hypothetical protein
MNNYVPTVSPNTDHHPRLSPGAIAGIVVGSLAFLSLVICGMFLILWRIRRNRRGAKEYVHTSSVQVQGSEAIQPITVTEKKPFSSVPVSSVGTSPPPHYPVPDLSSVSPSQPGQVDGQTLSELQQIQERRSRLMEIERLAQEENRLRTQLGNTSGRAELPTA